MTLSKWGHYPKSWGRGPIFEGSWRLQVDGKNTRFAGPSVEFLRARDSHNSVRCFALAGAGQEQSVTPAID